MIYFQSSNKCRPGRQLSSLCDLACSKMFARWNIPLSVGHGLCQLLVLYCLPSSTTVVINLVWVTDLFWEYEESSRQSSPQNSIHVSSSQPLDGLRHLLLWVFGRNMSKNGLGFCQLGIICKQISPCMSFSLCVFIYYNIFSSGN